MSVLIWFRDLFYGKKDGLEYRFTTHNPHEQKKVEENSSKKKTETKAKSKKPLAKKYPMK